MRFLTDFMDKNKRLERNPVFIERIEDIIDELRNFNYEITIDLRNGYYTLKLYKQSQELTMITLPWVLYN